MKTYQQMQSAIASCFALKVFGFEGDPNEENDREVNAFIESISLGKEELAAFLTNSELSIPEVKRHFARRPNIRTQ